RRFQRSREGRGASSRNSRRVPKRRQVGDFLHWPGSARLTIFVLVFSTPHFGVGPALGIMPRIVIKDLDTENAQTVSDLEATFGRDPACAFGDSSPQAGGVRSGCRATVAGRATAAATGCGRNQHGGDATLRSVARGAARGREHRADESLTRLARPRHSARDQYKSTFR